MAGRGRVPARGRARRRRSELRHPGREARRPPHQRDRARQGGAGQARGRGPHRPARLRGPAAVCRGTRSCMRGTRHRARRRPGRTCGTPPRRAVATRGARSALRTQGEGRAKKITAQPRTLAVLWWSRYLLIVGSRQRRRSLRKCPCDKLKRSLRGTCNRPQEGNAMGNSMLKWTALSLGFLLATTAAHAQSYPSKTITIIVTAAAGGVSDVVARGIGQRLSEAWGQQVAIENKGGGAHIIGAQAVAKAPPDGHTLLVAEAGTFVLNPTLYPKDKLAYDTEKDIAPITGLVRINQALIANNGIAAQNVRELIELANKKPSRIP